MELTKCCGKHVVKKCYKQSEVKKDSIQERL